MSTHTEETDVTLYDPFAFLYPLHAKFTYNLNNNPQGRMLYSTWSYPALSHHSHAMFDHTIEKTITGNVNVTLVATTKPPF